MVLKTQETTEPFPKGQHWRQQGTSHTGVNREARRGQDPVGRGPLGRTQAQEPRGVWTADPMGNNSSNQGAPQRARRVSHLPAVQDGMFAHV